MSLPVILRPEAEADIQETCHHLNAARQGLGYKFIARLRETLERIESAPELYAEVWRDVRAVRLNRFRYVTYYVAFADRVEVLAVVHGARDPLVWRSRT